MQQHEQYRCIWLAGNHDALLAGIREHLRKHYGTEVAAELDKFIWHKAEFAIQPDPRFGLVITVPVNGAEDANSWNEELRNFYEQVVRPAADRTGGVAVGLAEPGTMNRQDKT
jgi:hypothetical protein